MHYIDLILEAFDYRQTAQGRRFRVRVAESPAGGQSLGEAETVTLPADADVILRGLERGLTGGELIMLGKLLGAALFPPRARSLLERSREHLNGDTALRVRLKLDTYALADLPWEYAYIARPGVPADGGGLEGFLVLDHNISLVRDEILGQARAALEPVGGEVRLLVLSANPATAEFPALDLAAELAGIRRAVGDAPSLRLEAIENLTLDALQEALIRPAHVFHFAGHGQFLGQMNTRYGSLGGEGYLVLMGDAGGARLYGASKLALTLAGHGVRLVVLGACEGGRRGGVNPWGGIAPALTRAGIPAVVAMQYTVGDANAAAFSRFFYRQLAAGGSVDAAVTEGRMAIFNRGDADERDWGVPVLYLQAAQSVLFPATPPAPTGSPTTPGNITVNQTINTVSGGQVVGVQIGSLGGGSPTPATPRPAPPPGSPVDARTLRKFMVDNFSIEELQELCADVEADLQAAGIDLRVNLELVGGSGKAAQVLNLIGYLDRRGHLDYLTAAVRREHPGRI